MGKKAPISKVERNQIFTLHNKGYSEHKVGVKLHFNKTAAHNDINSNGTYSDMGRSGSQRKTSIRDDYMMKRKATCPPSSSCKKICAALLAKGTNVSLMTVSRCLSDEFCLKSHKRACKPRLTTAMKFKRSDFVKK